MRPQKPAVTDDHGCTTQPVPDQAACLAPRPHTARLQEPGHLGLREVPGSRQSGHYVINGLTNGSYMAGNPLRQLSTGTAKRLGRVVHRDVLDPAGLRWPEALAPRRHIGIHGYRHRSPCRSGHVAQPALDDRSAGSATRGQRMTSNERLIGSLSSCLGAREHQPRSRSEACGRVRE